jgi:uncharacterized iron-regulated membrane protein
VAVLLSLHRWTGALLGLLLALLGSTGALLVFKDDWLRLTIAQARIPYDPVQAAAAVERLLAQEPRALLLASEALPLHRLAYADDAYAYASQDGTIVRRWQGHEPVDEWLFELHHRLLAGDTGETVAGVAGLAGAGFVLSGLALLWPRRRQLTARLWPRRWARPALLEQHRNLGLVAAPLLLLATLSGAAMVFHETARALLSPGAPLPPPPVLAEPYRGTVNWPTVLRAGQAAFPGAPLRVVVAPRKPNAPILLRYKQTAEWHPNGRSAVYVHPGTGAVLMRQDALALPQGQRLFNLLYPLHAAKVGGRAYDLVIASTGLALTLLGLFTTWTFWRRRLAR